MKLNKYKITIEYLGTAFSGWQRQNNAISVQQILEDSIYKLTAEKTILYVAGRTDAGVHAIGQVAHFTLKKNIEPFILQRAINHLSRPYPISIIESVRIDDDFHARFSSIKRHYIYRIINRSSKLVLNLGRAWHITQKLNIESMQLASTYLIGKHDFTSFRGSGCMANSPIRTLSHINIIKNNDEIIFEVSAQSFLYHMVRNIVGSLVYVGIGKWSPEHIQTILKAKSRSSAGPTAPPDGLYFLKSEY
jgi:tRNA pseudouridine38-40 synthase